MHRTLDKRLDALAPAALDTLLPRLFAAYTDGWRQLTMREYLELERQADGTPHPRVVECNTAAGVPQLYAQCAALIEEAEIVRRLDVINEADVLGDAPLHPLSRLYRRFNDAEVERLADLPDETPLYPALLEVAAAYVDVDLPMGEQGL